MWECAALGAEAVAAAADRELLTSFRRTWRVLASPARRPASAYSIGRPPVTGTIAPEM